MLSLKRKEQWKLKREGYGKTEVFHFRLILQLAGTEFSENRKDKVTVAHRDEK